MPDVILGVDLGRRVVPPPLSAPAHLLIVVTVTTSLASLAGWRETFNRAPLASVPDRLEYYDSTCEDRAPLQRGLSFCRYMARCSHAPYGGTVT